MEKKYILTTKNYEDWRNYLLVNSFFFDILLKKLRKDLDLPNNVNIGGLIRDGKGITVNGNTTIQANDHVIVFCMSDSVRKLDAFFH